MEIDGQVQRENERQQRDDQRKNTDVAITARKQNEQQRTPSGAKVTSVRMW
jgi:hypothetical protein